MPGNISNTVKVNKNKTAFLNKVKGFIDNVMKNQNGLGKLITEIDVVNEPAFNLFLDNNFGKEGAIDIKVSSFLTFLPVYGSGRINRGLAKNHGAPIEKKGYNTGYSKYCSKSC